MLQLAQSLADRTNDGMSAMVRGEFALARALFTDVLAVIPYHPEASWNLGLCLFELGEYTLGLQALSHRDQFPISNMAGGLDRSIPLWRGHPLEGKRLLIHPEVGYGGGYGDYIMMMRFLPEFTLAGARVTFWCEPPVAPLARQFDVEVTTSCPLDQSVYDFRLPVFDLMWGTVPDMVPRLPYLSLAPRQSKPGSQLYRPTVGIAWSGRRDNSRDSERSLPVQEMVDNLACTRAHLVSLQTTEDEEAQRAGVETPGYVDFSEVALMMSRCDHVVCVDTAAANLAGAIGHPSCHLVVRPVPDWRWTHNWYPYMRIHRQTRAGDWASAFRSVLWFVG